MQKLIDWCKRNIFLLLTLFLLAFIPLYPKIPLIDVVQTWVYIRLEDIVILGVNILLLVLIIKQRKLPVTPLTVPFLVYWIVGIVVLLYALLFVFPANAAIYFPHLAVLHYLRRIEYMSVFFLAYEAVRRNKNLGIYISIIVSAYFLVLAYGVGQKFFGFPAYLTMNEEFAKGIPLRLPPTARIPSTFGGHYDLAAYLVLLIPLVGSLVFGLKKWWLKILFIILSVFGLEVLLFTASRISFGVYLVAISIMLIWQKKQILIVPVIVASIMLMNFTAGVSERFYKTFRFSDVIVDLSTGRPIGTLARLEGESAVLEPIEKLDKENLPKGSGFIGIGGTPQNETTQVKYYQTVGLASGSGEMATISGSFLIQKAFVYDISITTRFQGQWPRAIAAFKRNYLLGSGFSTLSVAADGDYHRMLGETGLLGTIAFLGILAFAFTQFFKVVDTLPQLSRSFAIGVFAGISGLLLNAVLIDVFEASKVAYTVWLLLGITLGAILSKKSISLGYYLSFIYRLLTSNVAWVIYLALIVLLVWKNAFSLYFLGDDFTWLRWAAESSIRDIPGFFTNAGGFFYRPVPKIWYFVLYSIFWLKPAAYYIASVSLVVISTVSIYFLMQLCHVKKSFAWIGALLFGVLSVHHENIFWISGQNTLLAGAFIVLAMYLFYVPDNRSKYIHIVQRAFAVIFLFLSMLSYEGMIVAPVIVWFIGVSVFGKRGWWHGVLVLIPIYLTMRINAGSLGPNGDYSYKASTFLVNSIANVTTYVLAIGVGPKVIEFFSSLRENLRPYVIQFTISSIVIVIVGIAYGFVKRRTLEPYRETAVWFLSFVLSLGAYMGLGAASERYAYVPSMFLLIGLTILVDRLLMRSGRLPKIVIGIAGIILLIVNIVEVQRVSGDWEFASAVSKQTMLKIRNETFPPLNVKNFFIINLPIRYGRAWIFPTGLSDAIWHMYRENPYTVRYFKTLEEAFSQPYPGGDREVFIFENYVLKRGIEFIKAETPVNKTEVKQ